MLRTVLSRFSQPLLRRAAVSSATATSVKLGAGSNLKGRLCEPLHPGISQRLPLSFCVINNFNSALLTTSSLTSDLTSSATDDDGVDGEEPAASKSSKPLEFSDDGYDGGGSGGGNASGDPRSSILSASLPFVSQHGWSLTTMSKGAVSAGFPLTMDQQEEDMFPRGPGELVQHFEEKCSRDLNKYLEELTQQEKSSSKVIRSAVEHRLGMLIPYMESWPQAMALKAFPSNLEGSFNSLSAMVDDMWYWAGDTSTEVSWYTKRAMVAAIYSSTELFMVQDTSEGFKETWSFLDHRFEDAKGFGQTTHQVEGLVRGGISIFSSGLSAAACALNSHKNT